jgi:serine/threonine protein kinase
LPRKGSCDPADIDEWVEIDAEEEDDGFEKIDIDLGDDTSPDGRPVQKLPSIKKQLRPPVPPPPPQPYIPLGHSIISSANPISTADFELISVVGRGSFGKVLQVRKKSDGRILAMKTITKRHIFEYEQEFHTITERTVLATVPHPFIPKLHYAFQTIHKLYMVLDYANGGELFTHLRRFVLSFPLL